MSAHDNTPAESSRPVHTAPGQVDERRKWIVLAGVVVAGIAVATFALILSARDSGASSDDPTLSAVGTEHIDQVTVSIELRKDGSARITESYDYDFGTAARHGLERMIPDRFELPPDDPRYRTHVRQIPLSGFAASSPSGAPDDLQVTRSSADIDQIQVRIGSPETTVTGTQQYELSYTAARVLDTDEDQTVFRWDALGYDSDIPINGATITVAAPADITAAECRRGTSDEPGPCSIDTRNARSVSIDGETLLGEGRGMTVELAFDAEAYPAPAPQYSQLTVLERSQRPIDWEAAFPTDALHVGGAIALLILFMVATRMTLYHHVDRRRPERLASGRSESSPPPGVGPGLAGFLIDGDIAAREVLATLVDLERRGVLDIRMTGEFAADELDGDDDAERPDEEAGHIHLELLTDAAATLAPHERRLIADMFGEETAIDLDTVKRGAYSRLRPHYAAALRQEAVDLGICAYRPIRRRLAWGFGGGVLAVASAILVKILVGALEAGWVWAAFIGGGLIMAAGAIHVGMPLTRYGVECATHVHAFRRYLKERDTDDVRSDWGSGNGTDTASIGNRLAVAMPYVIAFNHHRRWKRIAAELDLLAVIDAATMTAYAAVIHTHLHQSMTTPGGSGSSSGGGGYSGGGGGGGGGSVGSW